MTVAEPAPLRPLAFPIGTIVRLRNYAMAPRMFWWSTATNTATSFVHGARTSNPARPKARFHRVGLSGWGNRMQDECQCQSCTLDRVDSPPLVPTVDMPANCVQEMRRKGVGAVPRSCKVCGLGPCRFGPTFKQPPININVTTDANQVAQHLRQRFPSRLILGVSGLAGSGKSTIAGHLVNSHRFARVRFAGPLKAICAALGLDHAELEGDRKEVPTWKLRPDNWPRLVALAPLAIDVVAHVLPADCPREFATATLLGVLARVVLHPQATPRRLQQFVGTEWGRDLIAPDIWIRAWRADVDKLPAGQSVVADDCRFPNEADVIRSLGGFLVSVERPGSGSGAAGHSSEGRNLGEPVQTFYNGGTVDALFSRLDEFVRTASWVAAGTR